jgi:peptidoglycan/xylan/chitin deacetylase (PgdA/CDA1 family)
MHAERLEAKNDAHRETEPMAKLSLSFDNGPFPDVTPGVLEALADARATATFFVCGKDAVAPERRALLAAIRAAGHRIGNHTQTHRVELGATTDPDAPRREIEDAQAALAGFTDADKLFRPYGAGGVLGPRLLSTRAVSHLCEGGYTCVLWNSVPRDWEDVAGWPDRAMADLLVHDWTLLVLHDIPSGAMRALPDFLARARDAGAELCADLPPACVPIVRGRVVGALDGLVATD